MTQNFKLMVDWLTESIFTMFSQRFLPTTIEDERVILRVSTIFFPALFIHVYVRIFFKIHYQPEMPHAKHTPHHTTCSVHNNIMHNIMHGTTNVIKLGGNLYI